MQKTTDRVYEIKDGIKPVGDAPAQENRGALAGSGGQTPLFIENIGPIKSAEVPLYKTVLYGPNAAGKTTIAKSLKLMFSLLSNVKIRCDDLIESVRYGADIGRIAFKDYVVEIARAGDYKKVSVVIKKGDKVLYSGECTGGYFSTGLNVANDVLLWVGGSAVNMYGAIDEFAVTESDLFSPYVTKFISKCGGDCAQAIGDYTAYMIRVNDIIECITNGRIIYPPGELVYFFDGEHYYYYFSDVSTGIKRVAIIAGAIALAEKMAPMGKEPIVFIENIEDTLYVDYLRAVLDVISTTSVPVIIETHSGFVLKYAASKASEGWRACIVQDGTVTSDLTSPETFKHEVDLLR